MLLNCGFGEDSLESLGLQGDPAVYPKGNQSWIFIGRTDAEAEGHLMHWADSLEKIDAGKDWGQEEKEVTEDEMDGITDSVDMSLSKL